jgi:pyruvate dehydrogenase E1 component
VDRGPLHGPRHLRAHFEVDAAHIAAAAMVALSRTGAIEPAAAAQAIADLGIDPDKADPLDIG